jgi:hypothetical protein
MTASNPAFATPAPTIPPMSAWELDDGMPANQVTTFQTIAGQSAEDDSVVDQAAR